MQQVITTIIYLALGVFVFLVVGALLPNLVKGSREHYDKTPGRAFLVGLVGIIVLAAFFVGSVTLVRSAGLDFFNALVLLVTVVFILGAVVGLTALTQSVGARLFPNQVAIMQNIYGVPLVVLASLIPYIGRALVFPYLLISGIGGVAIYVNDWRKNKSAT